MHSYYMVFTFIKKKKKRMKNKLKASPNFSILCDKDNNPWLPDKCGVLLKVH